MKTTSLFVGKWTTKQELFDVLTELRWVFSEHMAGKKREKICHFTLTEEKKVAKKWQICWDNKIFAANINVISESKQEMQAHKLLERANMFTEEWYEAGLLLNEPEPHLPNNYSSDVGQLNPKMRTIRMNPNQKCLCQQTRDKELDQWFLNVSDESDKNASLLKKVIRHTCQCPNKTSLSKWDVVAILHKKTRKYASMTYY